MSKVAPYFNVRVFVGTTVIALLNSFYFYNKGLMVLLCLLEVFCLLDRFIRGRYVDYICLYLIFLAFSMESENFVGGDNFYGFKNFRVAGVNIAAWMLLPILFRALAYPRLFNEMGLLHRKILRKLTFFTVSGAIMGGIVYLVDDYGFRSKGGSLIEMINSYYGYTIPFFTVVAVSWALVRGKNDLFKVKQYLFACIPSTAIVFIACLTVGNYGNRMGVPSLQVSDIYFLLIASIVLVSYEQFELREKTMILASGAVIAVLSLMYNASGKNVIIIMLSPVVWMYILAKQGYKTQVLLCVTMGVLALILIPTVGVALVSGDNLVLQTKIADVAGLLNWQSDEWLLGVPESPRMRITEFMNVGYEYVLHPWYVIFGKGFCGSIQDHLNLFVSLNEATFSSWQLELGAYRGLHESLNVFFLVGGVSGLYILFSILGNILRNIVHSPWLMFGALWLFLFYGYHMSVSIFGITSLIVGVIDVDRLTSKHG